MSIKLAMAQNCIFAMRNITQEVTTNIILDKLNEKLRPPLPFFIDGKNGAFGLKRQLISDSRAWGVGWFYFLFYSVQYCRLDFCHPLRSAPEDPPRIAGSFPEQRLVIEPANSVTGYFALHIILT